MEKLFDVMVYVGEDTLAPFNISEKSKHDIFHSYLGVCVNVRTALVMLRKKLVVSQLINEGSGVGVALCWMACVK